MEQEAALSLVCSFFPAEWSNTPPSEVTFTKVTGGFVNRLYLLTRTSRSVNEPSRVLIRLLGLGDDPETLAESSTTLSAAEQALVYYEMGRRGWGPKLYGVFKGGRIEEWIDSHTLTPREATQMGIRRDMAQAYARFHSLDLPFRKGNFERSNEELKKTAATAHQARGVMKAADSPQKRAFCDVLESMDWVAELDWVAGLFKRYDCARTLALSDANYLNVLVKNYESEGRVMLIDYETATYGYRGIDMGGHFTERQYAWSAPESQLTGCPLPSKEEELSFCQSYQDEMVTLGVEMDHRDTLEHLWLEAKIGQLYQILFSVMMCKSFDWMEDVWLLEGLGHMLRTYQKLKKGFVAINGSS